MSAFNTGIPNNIQKGAREIIISPTSVGKADMYCLLPGAQLPQHVHLPDK